VTIGTVAGDNGRDRDRDESIAAVDGTWYVEPVINKLEAQVMHCTHNVVRYVHNESVLRPSLFPKESKMYYWQ
jgi:hypothetical protein